MKKLNDALMSVQELDRLTKEELRNRHFKTDSDLKQKTPSEAALEVFQREFKKRLSAKKKAVA